MKKLLTALVGLGVLFVCSVPSHAIPFTETRSDTESVYDFTGRMKFKGSNYLVVRDKSAFRLDDVLALDPQVENVESASITLYYAQVSPNARAEQWSVFAGGEKIGDLLGGPGSSWQSQTFTLSADLINSLAGSPFPGLTLVESTRGADGLLLDKIALSWQLNEGASNTIPDPVAPPAGPSASPVPEPSTVLLLGTSLVGLVGLRKRLGLVLEK